MRLLLACLLLALSGTTAAADPQYQIDLGPYVGGGSLSNGAKVRNTSGYQVALSRTWPVGDGGLGIAPRIEFANAFVNARADNGGETDISTYDNRIFAAGLTLSQRLGESAEAQRLYFTAIAGRAYSKLAVDSSTEKTYNQTLYGNIYGTYVGSELGGYFPLKGNLGLSVAVLASTYRATQGDATASRDGNRLGDGGTVYSLSQTIGKGESGLPDVEMRTYAAKIGLALGF